MKCFLCAISAVLIISAFDLPTPAYAGGGGADAHYVGGGGTSNPWRQRRVVQPQGYIRECLAKITKAAGTHHKLAFQAARVRRGLVPQRAALTGRHSV